jgi:hypothetical protein
MHDVMIRFETNKNSTTLEIDRRLNKNQLEQVMDLLEWQQATFGNKASKKSIERLAEQAKAGSWLKYGKPLV